jgi:hypothetical protein
LPSIKQAKLPNGVVWPFLFAQKGGKIMKRFIFLGLVMLFSVALLSLNAWAKSGKKQPKLI